MQPDNESASKIFAAVNEYIARSLRGFIVRLTDMEKRLASVQNGKDGKDGEPGIQGLPGKDGEKGTNGLDGKDGTAGENGKDGEPGIQGLPGKDGTDGRNGEKGVDGVNGKDGIAGKDGRDGKDVDLAEVRRMILEEVSKAIADIPVAKEGEPGRDGRDGKPGPAGRDATQIEYVQLDQSRSYPRGTHACYAGGILRAARTTDGFKDDAFEEAGWQAIVIGIKGGTIEVSEDGRDFVVELWPTAGPPIRKAFHIPVQKYRGVWKDGSEYQQGDTVTLGGSNWHANCDTRMKPGTNSDWTLIVKRGSDGRNATSHRVVSMQ